MRTSHEVYSQPGGGQVKIVSNPVRRPRARAKSESSQVGQQNRIKEGSREIVDKKSLYRCKHL